MNVCVDLQEHPVMYEASRPVIYPVIVNLLDWEVKLLSTATPKIQTNKK